MNFIPAKESRFYTWFFDLVTRLLISRRFHATWIRQDYFPGKNSRTIYFLNHNLWWDGLIPLFLNRKFFHQKARAIMEYRQMAEHSFFAKIGAFSIDLDSPKSTIQSLRYAVDSMQREQSCLFIYPEGELKPYSSNQPSFKDGLAWLYENLNDIDFVPVAIYTPSFRASRPELFICIGQPVQIDSALNRKQKTSEFEKALENILQTTEAIAGLTDEGFSKL